MRQTSSLEDDFFSDLNAELDPIELTHISELHSFSQDVEAFDGTEIASAGPIRDKASELNPESKYEMLDTIGAGAMGEILLARDQDLRRKVAYKKIHEAMAQNQRIMSRFFTEAQITAQLDHPNIIPVYSLEVSPQGEMAYSMKLIKGKTLKELLQGARKQYQLKGQTDNAHSLQELLEHFLKVCDAMHYSHIKGVIHRDLKPANIMIGPYNEVYVMDWGIAKVIQNSEKTLDEDLINLLQPTGTEPLDERTQLGQIMGTPRYLSPQQAAGKNNELDGRSDQFTLGLILFEIITLKPAFSAKDPIDLLKKILKVELNSFSPAVPKMRVPRELQAIVLKATSKRPEQRYRDVHAMADDIRRYLRGEAVLAKPDSYLQKLTRWMAQNREWTLALVMLIMLIASGTIIWSLSSQKQALKREQAAQLAAQQRKQKLTRFLLDVGRKAQIIDGQFIRFESLLHGVAGSLTELLEHGKTGHTYYLNRNYYKAGQGPPDLVDSQFYKFKMSTHWNVFKLAPGVQQTEVDEILQKASPIRHVLRDTLLASGGKPQIIYKDSEVFKRLEAGHPWLWVYAGLKQGIQLTYPGRGTFPAEYDTRKRPWFIQSIGKQGPQWLKPYLDVHGKGWVLPCTLPMYDSKGVFLGVAAFEMTLEYIRHHYMEVDIPGFENSYLINKQGQIVVSFNEAKIKYKRGTIRHTSKELQSYPNPEVLKQLKIEHSGFYEDPERVLAFYEIPSLGWYFLTEIAPEEI